MSSHIQQQRGSRQTEAGMDGIRWDAKSLIVMLVQVNKLRWYLINFLRFGQNRVLAIHYLTLGRCCLATSICFCFCQEPNKECQPSVCKTKLKPSSMNQHKALGSGPGTEVLGSPCSVVCSLQFVPSPSESVCFCQTVVNCAGNQQR